MTPPVEERAAASAGNRRRWLRLLAAACALVGIAILAGALLIGRHPGSEPGEPFEPAMLPEVDQQDIVEMLIKKEMRRRDMAGICFISLGPEPGASRPVSWRKSPPEFVTRFLSCAPRAKNVSEMVETDGAFCDKTTGERGCLYGVEFERRVGPNEFIVISVTAYGWLGGAGSYYRVRKHNGKWVAEDTGKSWIS